MASDPSRSASRKTRPARRAWALVAVSLGLGVVVGGGSEGATVQGPARPPAVLIVLDASGSMNASLGNSTRIAAAKDAVRAVISALPEDSLVGLRVYGSRETSSRRAGCRDTRLVVPIGRRRPALLRKRLASVRARGFTPIGPALAAGRSDLPTGGDRTIILVSDGIDTCSPPPPCEVAARIASPSLRVDAVGFNAGAKARRELRCMARRGGGRYVDARSAAALTDRLQRLALRAVRTVDVRGRRVSGAGTPRDAPLLEPGRYADRMKVEGDLWYALRLRRGQALNAAGTLVGSPLGRRTRFGLFAVRIYTPQLISPTGARGIADFGGLTAATAAARTGPVGLGDGTWSRAGTHYVRLTLDDAPELGGRSYPVQVALGVEGARRPLPPEPPNRTWLWIALLCAGTGVLLGAVATRTVRAVVDR